MPELEKKEPALHKVVRIVLTPRCNLSCSFCHNEGMDERDFYRRLALGKLLPILKLFKQEGVEGVSFTGGEPMLYKRWQELANQVTEMFEREYVHLTTNGVLLLQQVAFLQQLNLGQVNVSIPSIDPHKYEQITGSDLLPLVLKGVDTLLETARTRVHINVMVLKGINDTERALLDAVTYWQERPVGLDLMVPYRWPQKVAEPSIIDTATLRGSLERIGAVADSVSFGPYRAPVQRYKWGGLMISLRTYVAAKNSTMCVECLARPLCTEGISNPRISLGGKVKACLLGRPLDLYGLAVKDDLSRMLQEIKTFLQRAYHGAPPCWESR